MLKCLCGRKRSSSDNEIADALTQIFALSPTKSLGQCSREIGIDKSSVHQTLRAQKWKFNIPRFVNILNEDDPDTDSSFVSVSCTRVTKGKISKTQLLGQMKPYLNLMAQLCVHR